jgi:hypothetical protein
LSILDTFYLLFESNADEVKLATTKAEGASASLQTALNKDGEASAKVGKELEESGKKGTLAFQDLERVGRRFFVDTIRQIAELGTGFLGFLAVEKLFEGQLETSEMVEQLGNAAKALNVNVSDLDAWGQAVVKAGGTTEGFQQSIRSLNEHIAGIEVGGRGKEFLKFFHSIGVEALDAHGKMKPIMELLPELADALHKLPANQATAIGERLGFDQGTLNLLEQGKVSTLEMVEAARALGVVNQDDVEINEKFQDALKDTRETMRGVRVEINDYVLPVFTAFLEGMDAIVSYLTEHKQLIEGFFIGLASVLTVYYGPALVATALETWALIAPMVITIALIAALGAAFALAYDDLMNFYEGNNSVIGQLSKTWPVIGQIANGLPPIFKLLEATAKGAFKVIVDGILGLITYLFEFGEGIGDVIKWFTKLQIAGVSVGTALTDIFQGLITMLLDLGKMIAQVIQAAGGIKNIGATIEHVVTGDGTGNAPVGPGGIRLPVSGVMPTSPAGASLTGQDRANIAAGQSGLAATQTPLAAQTSGSVTGGQVASTINNNVTVGDTTVNTQATDPKAVSKAVGDTLSTHIKAAINHYSDGTQS